MYDEETEQLSDDLVVLKGQVVELTKVASNNYKGVSLFTDETQTEYKSIYQYLKEISEIYDELEAKPKQELLEKLFGKNRAQVGAAILSQMSTATEALETMENAEGSAAREMEVVSNSVTFALNNLKETLTGIAQSNITQDFLKDIINDATRFLEVFKNSEATIRPILTTFEKLISLVVSFSEHLGGLGTIIGGLALKNAVSGTGRGNSYPSEYARCNVVATLNELCA